MNNKLFLWSITVALAGFLFGFDTVIVSGAEKTLQEIWGSTDAFHGWVVVSSALWGTVIGAMFGGIPTDRIGRKNTLIWIGVLYFVSAIGSAMANDPWTFAILRFIGGLGVGASTIAAPAYIAEIAPAEKRGQLGTLYQFNIVFGILVAYFAIWALGDVGSEPWRWMIGIEAVPALIYALLAFTVPKSPRWLVIKKQEIAEARRIFGLVSAPEIVEERLAEIEAELNQSEADEPLFKSKWAIPLSLAFFISFFNQFSGINAFLYYAPRIFEMAGLGESGARLSSIGVGVINLIFTMLGMFLIDRLGRKVLLYIGSVGYIISLSLVAMAFAYSWTGIAVPIFLFLFIASHAVGQGAVIWVFISEIFPNRMRAKGQAFGVSIHWVLAAAIPAVTPVLFTSIGPAPVFAFFAFMMVLQLLWVYFKVPETKGKSLEQLEQELSQ